MYTLRRILEDGYEHNFQLGKSYTLILKERISKKEWEDVSVDYWGETFLKSENKAERECLGFVKADDGTMHFLLPWQKNYIVTERGNTFSKLT